MEIIQQTILLRIQERDNYERLIKTQIDSINQSYEVNVRAEVSKYMMGQFVPHLAGQYIPPPQPAPTAPVHSYYSNYSNQHSPSVHQIQDISMSEPSQPTYPVVLDLTEMDNIERSLSVVKLD